MSFAWPWCFLALPLPWLLRRLLPPATGGAALRLPSLPADAGTAAPPTAGLTLGLALIAWLLLVIAAARPQAPGETVLQPASGRNLMLAFDLSASMATGDLRLAGQSVDRFGAARTLADDFLRRRQGDRIGLVVFGSQAYLHTPLTFDLEAVRAALASAEVGLAGRETALGDAIALATKHLRGLPGEDRVLVLLTDGANTAGSLSPQRATWLARREGVRIHAVGIGAKVDEDSLRGIAEQSGGIYRRATDGAAMTDFWRSLESLVPVAQGNAELRRQRELYPWPLAAALLLVAGLILARIREHRQ